MSRFGAEGTLISIVSSTATCWFLTFLNWSTLSQSWFHACSIRRPGCRRKTSTWFKQILRLRTLLTFRCAVKAPQITARRVMKTGRMYPHTWYRNNCYVFSTILGGFSSPLVSSQAHTNIIRDNAEQRDPSLNIIGHSLSANVSWLRHNHKHNLVLMTACLLVETVVWLELVLRHCTEWQTNRSNWK
jgi:hypothetical protein